MAGLDDWLEENERFDWTNTPVIDPPPSTDWMDGIRNAQDIADKYNMVAFCEHCEDWWHFVRNMNPTAEEAACPTCGGAPSHRTGFQIMSKRTFNAEAAAKKRLPKKR